MIDLLNRKKHQELVQAGKQLQKQIRFAGLLLTANC